MLIIPIVGKISWRNPPYATIFLILVNCFVFFGFQTTEDTETLEVYTEYFDKGLSDIEFPRYIEFIENREGASELVDDYKKLKTEKENLKVESPSENQEDYGNLFLGIKILMSMENDSEFMSALYQEGIITTNDNEYPAWKKLRAEFDEKRDGLISYKFGLTPARVKPHAFLTHMFLHGGLEHLIGNMIFLWLFGCILEMGCGRLIYGIGYILCGLCASLFFFIVHSNSYVPMIGASGAISGLMGAMTVLFFFSRIKFFCSLGFYFDTFKIPPIILLPLWIGTEFFNLCSSETQQVAYMAHAGGLMGGALLGFVVKRFFSQHQKSYFEGEPEDKTLLMLENALSKIGRLDFARARPLLVDYLAVKPDNIEALEHLFNIDRQHPDDILFHKTAEKLLSGLIKSRADESKIVKTYTEYTQLAKSSHLPVALQIRLTSLFCENNQLDEAEDLINTLLQQTPHHPNLPTMLLRLIKGFEKESLSDKASVYRKTLLTQYPMSTESRMAGEK